ncbi:hypothetical protein GON03_16260 [Nocardioides sp. MAH-18]|uniref:Uncharacterized protein n=1 Tax=Nocardioides agri TaxID=2682843 RepID=A0A6L6XU75_9ACTN|nr:MULTISPECIES: hypothetical protein [unclassified Nocardioides]MBA2955890.1 hypothetical protein [Nocardioides sp. CGMCC 1.13656]MVQ50739.1 hypothetical protein [Nocardioides sp. MAH-18]
MTDSLPPGTAAGSLVGSIVGVDPTGDTTPGVLDTLVPERAVATLLAYIVVVAGASLLLVRRRDVTRVSAPARAAPDLPQPLRDRRWRGVRALQ